MRLLLREFEAYPAVGEDSASFAELKRILCERIAELEAELAIATGLAPLTAELVTTARPASVFTFAELEVIEDATKALPPHKLD